MNGGKIYGAIAAAMSEIGAISKSKKNAQQGFQYRGIDDVMNALYPILSRHGLFIAPEVLEHTREERTTKNGGNLIYSILKIRYTLYAEDGSSVSAVVIGEGMDSADKSSNKAMSVGMKYALFQLFCIPTEEMADPDAETPPESKAKSLALPELQCSYCGGKIIGRSYKNGEYRSAQAVASYTEQQTGKRLCLSCFKTIKGSYERHDAYLHEDAGDRI
jgi:hypothetical protein